MCCCCYCSCFVWSSSKYLPKWSSSYTNCCYLLFACRAAGSPIFVLHSARASVFPSDLLFVCLFVGWLVGCLSSVLCSCKFLFRWSTRPSTRAEPAAAFYTRPSTSANPAAAFYTGPSTRGNPAAAFCTPATSASRQSERFAVCCTSATSSASRQSESFAE